MERNSEIVSFMQPGFARLNIKGNPVCSSERNTSYDDNQFLDESIYNGEFSLSEDLKLKIVQLIENMFSDDYIKHDKFLMKHIHRNKEGFVSLKLISSLRKVKALTRDWRIVAKCLKNSQVLELNEEMTKIRRKNPLPWPEKSTFSKTVLAFIAPSERCTMEHIKDKLGIYGTLSSIVIVESLADAKIIGVNLSSYKRDAITFPFGIVEFEKSEYAIATLMYASSQSDLKVFHADDSLMERFKWRLSQEIQENEDLSETLEDTNTSENVVKGKYDDHLMKAPQKYPPIIQNNKIGLENTFGEVREKSATNDIVSKRNGGISQNHFLPAEREQKVLDDFDATDNSDNFLQKYTTQPLPDAPKVQRYYDEHIYKERHLIECFFKSKLGYHGDILKKERKRINRTRIFESKNVANDLKKCFSAARNRKIPEEVNSAEFASARESDNSSQRGNHLSGRASQKITCPGNSFEEKQEGLSAIEIADASNGGNCRKNFFQTEIVHEKHYCSRDNGKSLLPIGFGNDGSKNANGIKRVKFLGHQKDAKAILLRQPRGPDGTKGFKNCKANSIFKYGL